MLSDKRRLFLLVGLLIAAGCAYVFFHGVPWSASDDEIDIDVGDLGDPGTVAAAKQDDASDSKEPPAGVGSRTDATGNTRRPGNSADRSRSARVETFRKRVARIAERPRPEYLPELKQAARSPDEDARETALVGMRRLGNSADTGLLIHALRTDESPGVRVAAATALGKLKCLEAGPALIEALQDPDARVRSRAGAAMDRIIGVRMGFRANDPGRAKVIQKIRTIWREFYEAHAGHQTGRR